MNNITIKSLEAFQAIIETGSATAAAQKLNMTQPGISRLLSQFEQEVGFQLFYREKARLMPSEEALALVKEVELALSSVDRIGLLAKNIFSANWGELKVVAPNSFITGPLADAAADFMRQHPNVNLKLSSHSPARAREMVAHKAVDCGFIQMPETHPGLTCHPLLTSRTVCVVATSHPLAGLEQIHVSQLAGEPLILLGQGRYSRQLIDDEFAQAKVNIKVKLETHTVATACAFAKRNVGIAIVNEQLAKQYQTEDMKLIPLVPVINLEYGFIVAAHVPMNRLTQAFYQHCLRSIKDK